MSRDITDFLNEDPVRRHNFTLLLLECAEDKRTYSDRMKDYEQGLTDSELAGKWGVNVNSVSSWRHYHSLEATTVEEKRKKDFEAGLSLDELAKKWGIAKNSVRVYIKNKGWRR